MTDKDRIAKLSQALIAARYEITYWASSAYLSKKKASVLEKNLAKYDVIIETIALAHP